ncbi:hypothetical protein F5Y10DRAFT_285544 [Nemania abortiva]|nr:hypothetical protein F5Y10DRAFT_285544 [Nemania abortiva]
MSFPRTPRIPQKEWEARKSRLIKLYLDDGLQLAGLNGVIETMKNEGFIATKAQYEHHFRTWKLRKYMKRAEWEEIIKRQQQGTNPTSVAPPLTLAGRVISDARREKALRRYRSGIPQASLPDMLGGRSIPQERTDPLTLIGGEDTPVGNIVPGATIPAIDPDNTTDHTVIHPSIGPLVVNQDMSLLDRSNMNIGMPSGGHDDLSTLFVDGDDILNSIDFNPAGLIDNGIDPPTVWSPGNCIPRIVSDWPPGQAIDVFGAQQYLLLSPKVTTTGPVPEVPIQPYDSLTIASLNPPYIMDSLDWLIERVRSVPPSATIAHLIVKDICNAAGATSIRGTALSHFGLANNFLTDIRTFATEGELPAAAALAVANLLSATPSFREEPIKPPKHVSIDVITEARLYSRLVASIINGFTGLEKIPAAGVLMFLNKHQATSLLMIRLLSSNTDPVTKSLAENIFQAALEQDNVEITSFLLDNSNLEDTIDVSYHYRGENYTPLGAAILHSSFRVAKLLVERDVDVNKPFSPGSCITTLDLLLEYRDIKLTLDDRFFDLLNCLLGAGATVSESTIQNSLRFVDQRLSVRLIEESASQAPREIISNLDIVDDLVRNIEKPEVERMLRLMIEKCQELDASWRFYQYNNHEIVEYRPDELVEILLPYLSSLGGVLREVQPKCDYTIHSILQTHLRYEEKAKRVAYLIAALKHGHQDNIRALREEKVLGHVTLDGLCIAFELALKDANLQLVTEIIDFDPDLNFATRSQRWHRNLPTQLASSLDFALTHNFPDIAWKLSAIVIAADRFHDFDYSPLLYTAIVHRKPDLVRAIIRSVPSIGCEFGCCGKLSVTDTEVLRKTGLLSLLGAAIEWDDDSIMSELWEAVHCSLLATFNPYPLVPLLLFAIQNDFMDWFWTISKAHDYREALATAIENEDLRLLDELIACGVKLDDDHALLTAVSDHPSMVKPLLERYRRAYPQGSAGYGDSAVRLAISHYPQCSKCECSKSLDMLFEFGIVTGVVIKQGRIGKIRQVRAGDTLLSQVIKYHRKEDGKMCLVKRLLDAADKTNVTTSKLPTREGFTPELLGALLLAAIESEDAEIAKLLLQKDAEINKPASYGIKCTPLQKAAELNNLEIVSLLLDNGADTNAPPSIFMGATALQFAAINGNCEMAMLLIERGARLDGAPSRGPLGRWPLEGAAEHGRIDMIQLLWDINNGPFDNKQCRRAMWLAERRGHFGCSDLIKQLMATPSIKY